MHVGFFKDKQYVYAACSYRKKVMSSLYLYAGKEVGNNNRNTEGNIHLV